MRLAGVHPVDIALERVDLAVVRNGEGAAVRPASTYIFTLDGNDDCFSEPHLHASYRSSSQSALTAVTETRLISTATGFFEQPTRKAASMDDRAVLSSALRRPAPSPMLAEQASISVSLVFTVLIRPREVRIVPACCSTEAVSSSGASSRRSASRRCAIKKRTAVIKWPPVHAPTVRNHTHLPPAGRFRECSGPPVSGQQLRTGTFW